MENNSRRNIRISAMKVLYNMDLMNNTIEEAVDEVDEESLVSTDAIKLVKEVLEHNEEIEEVIKKNLVDYTINRLSYVDRAIIKVATWEMLSGLPAGIAINEALEVTKEFSNLDDNKAKSFNNKLLDAISKNLK